MNRYLAPARTQQEATALNIVIAGGTGLIGRHLVPAVIAQGHSVRLLARKHDARENESHRHHTIFWDPSSRESLVPSLAEADAVINLAGASIGARRWSARQKDVILQSRVQATRTIVRSLEQSRASVLINASGVGYYGDVPEGIVEEDHPPGSDFLARVCTSWEAAARSAERTGIRVVLLRFGFVVAREAPAFQRMILPFRLFAGGWYGSGQQWFPWIHIDDVVGTVLAALSDRGINGPINTTAPEVVRVKEFCTAVARVLHRPCWAPIPAAALRAMLGEMADLLLKGQRAVPARLMRMGHAFRFPTLHEALENVTA